MHKGFDTAPLNRVFTEDFQAVSFYNRGDKLKAIELEMHRGSGIFLLSMMSTDMYIERIAAEDPEEAANQVYVVPADEILPSDLITVREADTERLREYLVPQTKEY